MSVPAWRKPVRWLLLVVGLVPALLMTAGRAPAEPVVVEGPICLEQLQRMDPCQLGELFARAEVGTPLVGVARGRVVYSSDRRLPRVKVAPSNSVWRGKAAEADGHFINRWIGGVQWIESHYVIGPSWVDGRPTMIMEYPNGTPLFAAMHDELREVAPGLYLGPIFDRYPCVKFRGYLALQMEACAAHKARGASCLKLLPSP